MSESKILLGYEVKTGESVYLPLHHLAIFGMTQLSGKTTTLEALISRSGLRAIAFITKRGEGGFQKYNSITPYYKPRADWQFVEGLMNVALGEKVKYEPGMRWAIITVSKGAKDLDEVMKRAQEQLATTKKDFYKQLFEKLITYLEIVVPELKHWTFSDKLELSSGVNVMDLSGMRMETQHLVIASTIENALTLDNIIIIVPEAWQTMPQTKMTPVKWVAEQFIRKGASVGDYLWLDSQDIGGIDKTPLRQCDNWLMGRMKEAHEIERILKQLRGIKVRAEDLQTLPRGHFYAAIGDAVKKVYVLPTGVPEDIGRKVALGELTPEYIRDHFLKKVKESDEDLVYKEKYEALIKKYDELEAKFKELDKEGIPKDLLQRLKKPWDEQTDALNKRIAELQDEIKKLQENKMIVEKLREIIPLFIPIQTIPTTNHDLNLEHREISVTISHIEKQVNMNTDTVNGKILYCAINYLQQGFSEGDLSKILQEHGWNIGHSTLAPQLAGLVRDGYLVKLETRPTKYRLPLKLKINVVK